MARIITVTILLALFFNPAVRAQQAPAMPAGSGVAINPISVDVDEYLGNISLPPGFRISVYARGVDGARSMALGPEGTLFVGTRFNANREAVGKVYAIRDEDGDSVAEKVTTIAEGLNMPNGVAIHNGDLYVAEVNRIIRFDDIEKKLDNPPAPVVITDDYPDDFMHGWKFIRFGPDNKLYVPVGAPCNTCEPDSNHGVITRIDADGKNRETFAMGIRNTVGFDWHPDTDELWFTDNGRDMWGDDKPPEELNHAPRPGMHFGYPYRFGKTLVDDQFETDLKDSDFTPAALELPAHNAAIGMRFYTGNSFPDDYSHQALIALHGSWNRAVPDGYRVIVAKFKDNKAVTYEDFASGWLTDEKKFWGRPVDIEILPDGSILVSDDHANCIYRISYEG